MNTCDEVKDAMISRIKTLGIEFDISRLVVLQSHEVSENKLGFGILVDKQLIFTIYP
jgi:hypothetical protein